jgi:hypothetical protein
MTEIASLKLKVESDGVVTGTERLDRLTDTSKVAETQARNLGKSVAFAETEAYKMAKAMLRADAQTKSLTKTAERANSKTRNMGKSIAFAETEAYRMAKGMSKAETDARALAKAIDFAETEAHQMAKAMDLASRRTKQTSKAFTQTAKQSNVVKGNFGAMKGATEQLSYQLQDVAVQSQMGTSAFIILGQQGPQIASIFGPGGAVFGALIAFGSMIAGVLYNSLGSAEEGTEALELALSRLDDQLIITEKGTIELSKRILELAKVSVSAASAELIALAADTDFAFKKAADSVDEMASGIANLGILGFLRNGVEQLNKGLVELKNSGTTVEDLVGNFGSFTKMDVSLRRLRDSVIDVSDEFGLTEDQALRFLTAAGGLKSEEIKTYQNFRDVVDALGIETQFADRDLLNFRNTLVSSVDAALLAKDQVDSLKKALDSLSTVGAAGLVPMLEGASEAAEKSERERVQRIQGASDAEAAYTANLLENDQKELASTIASDQRKKISSDKSIAARVNSAENYLDNVKMLGLDEEQMFVARQKRISDRLQQLAGDRLISEADYLEGKASLQRESDERAIDQQHGYMNRWTEITLERMNSVDLMGATMAMNLTTNMGAAFESLLTGTASVEDSFKSFAKGMASSLVSALADMAAQWIAYQIVQRMTTKASEAGAATALGLNASAMSVMAGLSAFASTAAIPIVGPVEAPAAAAAAVAVTKPMAASIAALSGSAVAARALGGQVRGGQSYLVGERGPELLHMGTSGRVTPNQNLGGGGSVSIVNNIDASSAGPDLEIKIQQAMINTSRQTVSKIQDLMRRGRL